MLMISLEIFGFVFLSSHKTFSLLDFKFDSFSGFHGVRKWNQANNTCHAMSVAVIRDSDLSRLINVLWMGRPKGYRGKNFGKKLLWT